MIQTTRTTVKRSYLSLLATGLLLIVPVAHAQAFGAFLLFGVWPGIGLARWLGHAPHRRDALTLALAFGGSTALTPFVAFFLAQVVPATATTVAVTMGLLSALLLATAPPAPDNDFQFLLSRKALVLLLVPALMTFVMLVPLRSDLRASILPGYGPLQIDDWYKHYGIAWQIKASGIPPKNLMVFSDPPLTHAYHIFFYIPPALLDLASEEQFGLGIWLTVGAAVAVFAAFAGLYAAARYLWVGESSALAAIALLWFFSGLDAVPAAREYWHAWQSGGPPSPYVHVNAWATCSEEIATFATTSAFVPQHVTALGILVLAWLILVRYSQMARRSIIPHLQHRTAIAGAVLIASAIGHSVFVPLPILLALPLWISFDVGRRVLTGRRFEIVRDAARWLGFGLLTIALALPILRYELPGGAGPAGLPVAFWIRAAADPNPVRGSPFQWLFPQTGVLAQLLDLPFLLIVEIGAPLLLAALAVRQRRLRTEIPGVQIAIVCGLMSLAIGLFVRSTLGCNDLGMRAIIPFQALVALLAGEGFVRASDRLGKPSPSVQAIGSEPGSVQSWIHRLWRRFGSALLPLALVSLAYQVPYAQRMDIVATDDARATGGLYPREVAGSTGLRWTKERLEFVLEGLSPFASHRLSLSASAGARPPDAPSPRLTVLVNGHAAGEFLLAPEFKTFEVDLAPTLLMPHSGAVIELIIPPFRPSDFGEGDSRRLGMLLDNVELVQQRDPPLTVPPPGLAVGAVLIACALADLTRRRAASLAASLSLAALLIVARQPTAELLPVAATMAVAVWFIATLVQRGGLRRLLAPLLLIGIVTNGWTFLSLGISKFLPPFDMATAEYDILSIDLAAALHWIRARTPADSLLIVEQDPASMARATSVAAERRHYYTGDYVFVYDVAGSEERLRRQLVQALFSSRSPAEACAGFKALGVSLVLADMRHYEWARAAETAGCFKTGFQGRVFVVLELQ